MTNTLHRFGKPENMRDDYIVFLMAAKGINEEDALEKARIFLRTALKYNPVNIGNSVDPPLFRPEKTLTPVALYLRGRKEKTSPTQLIAGLTASGSTAVVFDNKEAMEGFVAEVKDLELGLSINVSALSDDTREACRKSGIKIHSVEYTLGFQGDVRRLPNRQVLSLTSMCGHGMISASFAQRMIDRVKEARLTPEKAAGYMAKFCICGVFNTSKAVRILKEIKAGK